MLGEGMTLVEIFFWFTWTLHQVEAKTSGQLSFGGSNPIQEHWIDAQYVSILIEDEKTLD
jgi:hypothetical protein